MHGRVLKSQAKKQQTGCFRLDLVLALLLRLREITCSAYVWEMERWHIIEIISKRSPSSRYVCARDMYDLVPEKMYTLSSSPGEFFFSFFLHSQGGIYVHLTDKWFLCGG
jgi:hypothetical protein